MSTFFGKIHPTCIKGYTDTLTRETQALFKNFDAYFSVCQPDYDPGHLFNMSTVLLANSIIQKFIKDIFDVMQPLLGWSRRNWKNSLTSQLNKLFVSDSENRGNPLLKYDGFLGKFKQGDEGRSKLLNLIKTWRKAAFRAIEVLGVEQEQV